MALQLNKKQKSILRKYKSLNLVVVGLFIATVVPLIGLFLLEISCKSEEFMYLGSDCSNTSLAVFGAYISFAILPGALMTFAGIIAFIVEIIVGHFGADNRSDSSKKA